MFWVIWTETDWIMSDMDLIMGDLEWNHEWFGMESWVICNRLNLEWSGAVWILSDLEWNRFGGVWMVKWNGLGCCVILFSCCNVLKALKECVYMVCRWVWFFLVIILTYEFNIRFNFLSFYIFRGTSAWSTCATRYSRQNSLSVGFWNHAFTFSHRWLAASLYERRTRVTKFHIYRKNN